MVYANDRSWLSFYGLTYHRMAWDGGSSSFNPPRSQQGCHPLDQAARVLKNSCIPRCWKLDKNRFFFVCHSLYVDCNLYSIHYFSMHCSQRVHTEQYMCLTKMSELPDGLTQPSSTSGFSVLWQDLSLFFSYFLFCCLFEDNKCNKKHLFNLAVEHLFIWNWAIFKTEGEVCY